MQIRKKIAWAAALALPLTALGAAPAFAGSDSDKDTPKPSIYIKDVDAKVIKKVVVHKYDDGTTKKVVKWEYPDPVVKVKYTCYTEQDKYKPGKEVEYGTIDARLEQKKAERWGSAEAICDGEDRYAKIYLDDGYGKLKKGDAWVKVKITDPQDKTAKDKDEAEVKLVVKKKVIQH